MDRELYKSKISFHTYGGVSLPEWTCPTCQKGSLDLVGHDIQSSETATCRIENASHDPRSYEHELSCSFSLKCSKTGCGEAVYCVGSGKSEIGEIWQGEYTPLFFMPNLAIFSIPNDTPKTVKKLLNDSFALFFTNPSASVNQVRRAIETLLDDLGIKSGQLDHRIKIFQEENKDIGDALMATKHLGNAGSHSSDELTADDVLDSYEIMEKILKFLYKKTDLLTPKINEIIGNKGPIREKPINLKKGKHKR